VADGNAAYEMTAGDGLNYGSDWVFDSSLEISICSDTNKDNSIGCIAQNLKVFYYYYGSTSTIDFANSGSVFLPFLADLNLIIATLIADYKLDEGNGNTLTNPQGTIGDITLRIFHKLFSLYNFS